MKKVLALLFICGIFQTPVLAAPAGPATCPEFVQSQINFKSDETLFTVLAWLNWIGERDEKLDLSQYDQIQADLMQELSRSTALKSLYAKHRAVYETYLKGADLYSKNGLLLHDAQFYGPAPDFQRIDVSMSSELKLADRQRIQSLPPAAILAEFYQALNLKQGWLGHYKPTFDKYLNQYRNSALEGIKRAQCFLKVLPAGQVDVVFNPLDSFGTAGQTSYDPVNKRFLIKLHINLQYTNQQNIEETAAHEYTHALMNSKLESFYPAFEDKLNLFARSANQPDRPRLPIQELLAQSVGYMKAAQTNPTFLDQVSYRSFNPVLPHLLAQQGAYQKSGKAFDAFLPQFLQTFDPIKAGQNWQVMGKQIEVAKYSNPKTLKALQKYGLDTSRLFAAVEANQALLAPKLDAFLVQTGARLQDTDLKRMLFECFSQDQYTQSPAGIRENVFFIYKNPLYFHFTEQLKQIKGPIPNVQAFIKTLFESFDAGQEARRWKAVDLRFQKEKS